MTDNKQSDPNSLAELFQDNDPPEPTALDRALQREFGDEWYLYPHDRPLVRQVARLTLALSDEGTQLIERVVTAQQLVAAAENPSNVRGGMERVQDACRDAALRGDDSVSEIPVPDGTTRFVSGLAHIEQQSAPGDFALQSQSETGMSLPESLPEKLPGAGEATQEAYDHLETHCEGREIALSLTELSETLDESGYTAAEIDKALANIQHHGYVYISADGEFRCY
jgi:hypothetical protein